MNLHDVKRRARALLRPHRVEQELQDELEFHIERETKTLIDGGLAPLEARRMARVRFGSAARAADECRDKRGTAVIDHTIRDIQYALRTFKRAPLTSLTIVATVATGLGVVAVLFTILNALLFRVDAVPDIAQLYAVERPRQADGGRGALFTRPRVDALRSDTSVFTDAYAMLGDIDLRVDGRTMAVSLVSGSFFHVVGVNPVMGRPFGAADDDRAGGNPVVVLSDKGWQRHFNRDPNVLGRTVLVAGAPFEIVGVMPMGFRGLEVSAPDFWAPLPRLADFRPGNAGDQDSVGVEIIGRLKPDVSISAGYFDVLGIPIVRGRPFAATERDDCPVVIVSESVARVLWPNRSGVGETFWLAPDSSSRPSSGIAINPGARPNDDAQMPPRMVTVVGVSRDVAGFRLTDVKDAGVFLPTALEVAMTSVVARVQGDPGLARQTLIERLTRIDPSLGMIVTLRTVARLETFSSRSRSGWR